MGIIVTEKERIAQLEREKAQLQSENRKLQATVEYIAVCSYPEILEEEENDHE